MTDELVARLMARLRERMCACGHNGLDHYALNLENFTYSSEPSSEFVTAAMGKCRHSDCGCMQMLVEPCASWELDKLIAEKVMGVTNPCSCEALADYTNDECNTCGGAFVEEYSSDIDAAWLVAEKLRLMIVPIASHEWERDLDDGQEGDLPRGWAAAKCSASERRDTYFEVSTRCWSFADTAPLAICRAALKAVRT